MAAIKKIVLQIRDKEIILDVGEAKELKSLLSELFGRDVVKEIHHTYDHWYYRYGPCLAGQKTISDYRLSEVDAKLSYSTKEFEDAVTLYLKEK